MGNWTWDFDEKTNRIHTNSAKWDGLATPHCEDMIHMGVADMDFKTPEPVLNAVKRVLDHGILGYTIRSDAFYQAICSWYQKRYNLKLEKEWILFCPRINVAAGLCVDAFTKPEESVIMQTPSYGPLREAVLTRNRQMILCPFIRSQNGFYIDFEQLEQAISSDTRLMILCNPHNPTGTCWSEQELKKLAEFCNRHKIVVFSDEIHGDLVKQGYVHQTLLSLADVLENRLIVASSPAKTFNLPGTAVSFMIIKDKKIRERVAGSIRRAGVYDSNVFSVDTLIAAYTECDDWYESVKDYIDHNECFTREFMEDHLPDFQIMPREATYLLWIDYQKTGMTEEEMEHLLFKEAHVSVQMGSHFGEEGRGYFRINIATQKTTLEEALNRIAAAYQKYSG